MYIYRDGEFPKKKPTAIMEDGDGTYLLLRVDFLCFLNSCVLRLDSFVNVFLRRFGK